MYLDNWNKWIFVSLLLPPINKKIWMQLQRRKVLHSSCYHSVKYLLAIFNILKITSKFNSIICILYKGNHYNTTVKALWCSWVWSSGAVPSLAPRRAPQMGARWGWPDVFPRTQTAVEALNQLKKKKTTAFDILVIALMQGIRHFLLVFIQNSYLGIFVQITVKKNSWSKYFVL